MSHLEPCKPEATLACGCPSTNIQNFKPAGSACREANTPEKITGGGDSALTHWPIQILLVPPNAGFLKNADLLVLADCTAVAFPSLHQDLLKGKVVLMGCPKFDETEEYVRRFTEIFKTADIRSVSVAVMEVPCCAGLPMIVKKGMAASGKSVPIEQITIGVRGNVQKKE